MVGCSYICHYYCDCKEIVWVGDSEKVMQMQMQTQLIAGTGSGAGIVSYIGVGVVSFLNHIEMDVDGYGCVGVVDVDAVADAGVDVGVNLIPAD